MAAPRIPRPLPAAGFSVSIDRIDSSYRLGGFLPGYSHNDISPKLVLHPTYLEVKVMQTSQHPYTDLKEVDYSPEGFFSRAKVMLQFAGGTDYSIKPSSVAVTRDLLGFFHERGLPLTRAAQQGMLAG